MRFAIPPQNLSDIAEIEKTPLSDRLHFNTPYEVIEHAAKTWGDKSALIFLPQGNATENAITTTYKNLLAGINQAANLFSTLHAKNGNVISYLLPNLPQTHFTLWGAQVTGIVNPLRPDLSPEQIATLMRKANSKTLVTIGEFIAPSIWQTILTVRKLYPELKTIFVIGGKADEANGIYDFDQSLDAQSPRFAQPNVSPDAVCAYFHTSATTTPNPKLVRLTRRAQIYAAWAMGTCLGYQENDIVAVGLPFFHVGAPMVGALAPFMCGATTVLMSPMGWMGTGVVENFWPIVKRYNVTVTAALNFIYSQLLRAPGIEKCSLRLAISGTALSPHESAQYKKLGIQVADIYGSSETMMACFNPPDNARSSSMGLRFPYEQMKVIKSDGSECAPHEVGELWISGPNVTLGYQQNAHPAFSQAWFKTGDLVHQDNDGYFWFFDRTADVIHKKTGAISSLMLEHLFEAHPKIDRAAAIGQPDAQQGEVPILFVTAKPGVELSVSELQQWSREHIDATLCPVEFFIEHTFPLNGIAKIVKPILRERNIVGLYSKILNQLFAQDVIFDVSTSYNSHDQIVAEIHLSAHPELHDSLIEKMNAAFRGLSVPIHMKLEAPEMGLRM